LWGELSEAHANTNLRKALTNLRRQLPGWLTITRQTVAFNPEKLYQLDVADFEVKAVDGLAQARLDWLEEAVALYQGDFLVGFQVRAALAFEEWVRAKQSQLRELAIQTLDALAGHYPTQGEAGQALALTYTRQLLTLEPWREEAHRHLMRLLALTNQRSAALAQYELCRQVLAAEFGVEPGPETTALYEQLRTGLLTQESLAADGQTNDRPIFQPLNPAAPPTRYNLPAEPTPFIGRELELRALGGMIAEPTRRLITIAGAGGMGKTRLALAAAKRQVNQSHFPNGIYFVPLAPLSNPAQIISAMAEALNLNFYEGNLSRRQLLTYLSQKRMLLILDNFEHLLNSAEPDNPGGVDLVAEILQAAPSVKLVTTSRERLHLQQEQLYPIHGLTIPDQASSERPLTQDAVRLFQQSAKRVRPEFEIDAAD
jgi:DNA-binding SARP family transcriptional activator